MTDQMAPDASPNTAKPKKTGVRRINNMPLYILGGVLLSFLLVMAMVAADRSAKQSAPSTDGPKKPISNTSTFAKEVVGNKSSGLIAANLHDADADNLSSTSSNSTPVSNANPTNTLPPPTPDNSRYQATDDDDDDVQRIRMAKLQIFDEAVRAKTAVSVDAPRSNGSTSSRPQTRDEMLNRIAAVQQQIDAQRSNDPTAAYQARLAQIRSMDAGADMDTGSTSQLLQSSGMAQFQGGGADDRWKLEAQPETPRSPFELRAGFVVPATLISGINSDLPGQIIAQVAQDVYDTPTGKFLLIPQGSRLVGSYASDVAFGQARVLVAWQRIVFPDGKALDIGAMPGADSAGYAGFNDQVNNHYLRLFGSALLMSSVSAGVTYSQRDQTNNNLAPNASSALSEALGQQLGQVTAQLIAKNMNIAPTLEIRPGYRFNVVVTKDMTFSKPYSSFDY